MSAALISAGDCCNPCTDPVTTQVPGPPGPAGTNGTNGADGLNAYTVTTGGFTMPASGANTASIPVAASGWATVGQVVFVQSAGYFSVISKADATHLVLKNLGYAGNAAPATAIATAQPISSGGLIGTTGPAGTDATPSPTTTKGDLILDNGANSPSPSNVRLAVGANGLRIMADSTQPTGQRYAKVDVGDTTQVTGIEIPVSVAHGGTGATAIPAAFDNLAPSAPVRGDIIAYDGTHWIRRPRGLVTQVLTTNVAGDAVWTDRGRVMQEVVVVTAATSTVTTTIPFDDTIPQDTEGTQLFSQAVTPKDPVNSYIEIEVLLNVSTDVADTIIAALFTAASADALSVASTYQSTANKPHQIALVYQFTAAGSAFTAKLRIGTAGGANLHVNAIDNGSGAASRKFGGAQLSYMRIREFSVAGF